MLAADHWWRQDLPARASGIALLAVGVLVMWHLFHNAHGAHDPTVLEMGSAATGFLGCSLGGGLTWLGAHIHDEVEIAERWRVHPLDRQDVDRPSSEELLRRFGLRSGVAVDDAGARALARSPLEPIRIATARTRRSVKPVLRRQVLTSGVRIAVDQFGQSERRGLPEDHFP